MAISPWLWLNEAAGLIASRLMEAEPQRFADFAGALEEARNELLEQAYRGTFEVQGKWDKIEEEPRFAFKDWEILNSEFWRPEYISPSNEQYIASMKIYWDRNYLDCEDIETELCGYEQLRVRSEDIDRIWPSTTISNNIDSTQSDKPSTPIAGHNLGGPGAPRIYRDDLLIEIIRITDTHPDGLPEDRSMLKRRLREFSAQHWLNPPSDTTIHDIVSEVYRKVRSRT
jgi:hypothetical protein